MQTGLRVVRDRVVVLAAATLLMVGCSSEGPAALPVVPETLSTAASSEAAVAATPGVTSTPVGSASVEPSNEGTSTSVASSAGAEPSTTSATSAAHGEEGHQHEDGDEDRHEQLGGPLTPVAVNWYESFCGAAAQIMLQGGPDYTIDDSATEQAQAHRVWLDDIVARTDAAYQDLQATPPTDVTNGAVIQQEMLAVLAKIAEGATAASTVFASGTEVDGVGPQDPAWTELALRPYTSEVDVLNELVSAYGEQLMPHSIEAQVEAIGDCGELLHVH